MFKSFQTKIQAVVIGVSTLALLITAVAVLMASYHNALEQMRVSLATGARVFGQLMDSRAVQLVNSGEVLTADFGFKKAVATHDTGTIGSALANQGARIGADVMMLVGLDGKLTATAGEAQARSAFPFPKLIKEAAEHDGANSVIMLGGRAYQVVIVPIKASTRIAWVCIGFAMNDQLADRLKSLTNLDVSFLGVNPQAHGHYSLASTLPVPARASLLKDARSDAFSAARIQTVTFDEADYLTLKTPLSQVSNVVAVLQSPIAAAIQPFHRLELRLVGLLGVVLLLSIAGATFLGRGITRPLRKLAAATRMIGQGDYNKVIETSSADELGQLASTLNVMQKEIAERESRIAYQAYHDNLTGLPNRAVVNDRLQGAIARAKRQQASFAVVMVDLNRFKEINDTLGHEVGDQVIQQTANFLQRHVRESDIVARLGGDEFMLVLEGANEAQALTVMKKLIDRLAGALILPDLQISLNLSVGVAMYPNHAEQADKLMRRADIAMYTAKNNKVDIAVYQPGQDERHLRQITILNDLRKAIRNDDLDIHYQPKIDIATGQVTQAEALVRWTHPTLGRLPPDEFITLAEQAGSIRPLTQWVLRTVIRQMHQWSEQRLKLDVSLNLSALDLMDSQLPETILALLQEYGVEPGALILEITESAVMQDTAHAAVVLGRLSASGIRISIDDFGTGYSSLAQLKRLPVNEIKIDKSFVIPLQRDTEDAVIVRSTIDLGHSMGLRIIAEGVETSHGLSLLEEYGCDTAQGFYFSRPLASSDFVAWLKQYDEKRPAKFIKPIGLPNGGLVCAYARS